MGTWDGLKHLNSFFAPIFWFCIAYEELAELKRKGYICLEKSPNPALFWNLYYPTTKKNKGLVFVYQG